MTSPIRAITLCKYTGTVLHMVTTCTARGVVHPDEDCTMLYFSADAIEAGAVDVHMPASIVRDDLYEGTPHAAQ